MVTHQISHNKDRSIQLTKIMRLRPELTDNPEEASAFLLFEYYDKILGDGHWEAIRKEPSEATKIVSVG